jgi:biopolymer transport protein ExbB
MDTVVPPNPAPDAGVNLDVIALIQQGALSTYPLLICSIIVLGVLLERLWSLRGMISSIAQLSATVVPLLARGDLRAAADAVRGHPTGPAQRVFGDLLATGPATGREDLERIADNRQFEEIQGCGAYLWILGTIGSSAPFVGLFGTVMGIIRAFHSMALVGTGGFGVVAGGISEALIATALGLAVGIVAVVAYNYLQARVERIDASLRIGSDRVLEALAAARGSHGV